MTGLPGGAELKDDTGALSKGLMGLTGTLGSKGETSGPPPGGWGAVGNEPKLPLGAGG